VGRHYLLSAKEKPMPKDDQAAREARAKELAEQIDELLSGSPSPKPAAETAPQAEQNPREFVHRRRSK
jgi:hypothetical protein